MRISRVALLAMLSVVSALPFLACTAFDDLAYTKHPSDADIEADSTEPTTSAPPSGSTPPDNTDAALAFDAGACDAAHEHHDATRCYWFNPSRVGWRDADAACVKWGGRLVSVRDADDLTFLRDLVQAEETGTASTGVWIGLNSLTKANEWTWIDETPFAFTNWAATEPDTEQPPHQCVYQYGEQYVGHWDNFMCSVQAESVCVRPLRAL